MNTVIQNKVRMNALAIALGAVFIFLLDLLLNQILYSLFASEQTYSFDSLRELSQTIPVALPESEPVKINALYPVMIYHALGVAFMCFLVAVLVAWVARSHRMLFASLVGCVYFALITFTSDVAPVRHFPLYAILLALAAIGASLLGGWWISKKTRPLFR